MKIRQYRLFMISVLLDCSWWLTPMRPWAVYTKHASVHMPYLLQASRFTSSLTQGGKYHVSYLLGNLLESKMLVEGLIRNINNDLWISPSLLTSSGSVQLRQRVSIVVSHVPVGDTSQLFLPVSLTDVCVCSRGLFITCFRLGGVLLTSVSVRVNDNPKLETWRTKSISINTHFNLSRSQTDVLCEDPAVRSQPHMFTFTL